MRYTKCFAILSAVMISGPALADDWKPASVPLMTKWGKQVTPQNAWPEYPRPQLVRKDWQNLNGLWDYAITPKAATKPEKWDGKILVPFCAESALSGVGKPVMPDQLLWYRRTIELPAKWKDQRIFLHFGAVDWEATVFLNDKEVGVHRGGFDPFSIDITDHLKEGANELVLRVWDPTDQGSQPRGKQKLKPGGIWYTPVTGIWQTVWLEPVNKPGHITSLEIITDLEKNEVSVTVNISNTLGNTYYSVEVLNGETSVGKAEGLDVSKIKIANAKHWTPDSPNLYRLKVSIHGMKRESGSDDVESYFAFRKIAAAKDENGIMRLMLNGKPLFQIGPLDQGWWPDGLLTPPSDEAMAYDLKVLEKYFGMNMLRKHIKVEPARLYYHCDRLGLVVWQDMPSGMGIGRKQFVKSDWKMDGEFTDAEKKQFRVELKAMIDHLRFFPCIVAWVPFNEGWGQHDTNDILKWVLEYDRTRVVDGPSGWTDRGFGDMKDMHSYPGPGMFPTMDNRVSVLGEFGGLGLPVTGHLWKDTGNWGYRTLKTTEELRQGYRQLMLRLHPLILEGLAAAVYTQTTDVEVEVNGLMTYDREVIKLDPKETAAWHKKLFGPLPTYRVVVPTSQQAPQKWRYTTTKPDDGWEKPDFDAGKWTEADGGFGTKLTPGTNVRTEWKTADIWLRRTVDIKEIPAGEMFLRIHHDEDAEIYINGVLAAKVSGFTTNYVEAAISAEGRKALKPGANVIAVHCHQTGGGQYIDVGLVEQTFKK